MREPLSLEIPPAVRAARRLIETVSGVSLVADLKWFADEKRWGFKCRIAIAAGSEFVPTQTNWWVLLEPSYPWGGICFYPALENSITHTFPHQKFNGLSRPFWRSGELCLRSPLFRLQRQGYDIDPVGQPKRLKWHLERAKKWLTEAVEGRLLSPGDAFELPIFPLGDGLPRSIATIEDASTFAVWNNSTEQFGTATILEIDKDNSTTFVVSEFSGASGSIVTYPLGYYLKSGNPKQQLALWIRLSSMPEMPPYQTPITWADTRKCAPQILDLLQRASHRIRDGLPHFLLIGFPVPELVDGPPVQMHWQPISLPTLAHGTQHTPGFRTKSHVGYWRYDQINSLRSGDKVIWQEAENWSSQQSNARGRYSSSLCSQSVAVIGVGAIGAHLADLLVRGGVDKAVVVDGELVEHGNLCRHVVGMGALDMFKSRSMMARLNAARATAEIDEICAEFPDLKDEDRKRLEASSLIIDCTGSDEVLQSLETYPWPSDKLFCSVSVGYNAKRIYVYLGRGNAMLAGAFRQEILPWLEQDLQDADKQEPPRENVGCWHISFPARIDHIVIAAAMAIRCLEDWALKGFVQQGLRVFEQGSKGIIEVTTELSEQK